MPIAALLLLAATVHVDVDNLAGPWDGSPAAPFASIQDGIDAATAGDLVLVQPGVYAETIDFLGKAIEVASAGGRDVTTIAGDGTASVVVFESGEPREAVLRGFTVTGGGGVNGGGVRVNGAGPSLVDNAIRANVVLGSGGGVFCFQATPYLAGNLFEDNVGPWSGGGLNLTETVAVVVDNEFRGNFAGKRGGGVRIRSNSTAVLARNVIVDNESPYGGGLSGAGGTIVDNLVAGNLATEYGGGVYWSNGDFSLANNTIVGNTALLGGGGIASGYDASATVANTIVWGNVAPQGPDVWVGDAAEPSSLAFSRCDVAGGPAAAYLAPGSTLDWPAGNLALDPLLDAEHRPTAESPVVDAGATAALPADAGDLDCDGDLAEPTPLDLAGNVRANGPTDMGAFEFGAGLPSERWTDLGSALAGALGTPALAGGGTLCAGTPIELALTGALPASTTALIVGVAPLDAPFQGGTLVPAPTLIVAGLPTGPAGALTLASSWPAGVPSGATLLFQHWIADAGGPQGLAASNALSATAP